MQFQDTPHINFSNNVFKARSHTHTHTHAHTTPHHPPPTTHHASPSNTQCTLTVIIYLFFSLNFPFLFPFFYRFVLGVVSSRYGWYGYDYNDGEAEPSDDDGEDGSGEAKEPTKGCCKLDKGHIFSVSTQCHDGQ